MLGRFEVHHVAAILLPREDIRQRGFVPFVTIILTQRLIFARSPPLVFHVESGEWDLRLHQIYGDLVSVIPVKEQAENKSDNWKDRKPDSASDYFFCRWE